MTDVEFWTLWATETLPLRRATKMRDVVTRIAAEAAETEDGQTVARIVKKKLPHRDLVWKVFEILSKEGLLRRLDDHGRYGIDYRLLVPADRDREFVPCSNLGAAFANEDCEHWLRREDVPAPDIFALNLRACLFGEYGVRVEDHLILCPSCLARQETYAENTCPGCGNPDVPCFVNGRPVCVSCFTAAIGTDYLREIMAGRNGRIDLSRYVKQLEGLTLT